MRVNRRRVLYLCAALTLLALLCCALSLHHDCDEPACALCRLIRLQRAALGLIAVLFSLPLLSKGQGVNGTAAFFRVLSHPTLFDLRVLLSI